MDLSKLKEPFPEDDIEWRLGRAGEKENKVWALALAYVTNRAIQNRLDDVCGPERWKNEFKEWHGESQICGISIKCGDEWITKWDGADNTGFESTKGGLSVSMKRAGYQWGIGRYLYELEETFVDTKKTKVAGWKFQAQKKNRDGGIKHTAFWWDTPELPTWALPTGYGKQKKEIELLNLDQVTEIQTEIQDRNIDDIEAMIAFFNKTFSYDIKEVADIQAKNYGFVLKTIKKYSLRQDM